MENNVIMRALHAYRRSLSLLADMTGNALTTLENAEYAQCKVVILSSASVKVSTPHGAGILIDWLAANQAIHVLRTDAVPFSTIILYESRADIDGLFALAETSDLIVYDGKLVCKFDYRKATLHFEGSLLGDLYAKNREARDKIQQLFSFSEDAGNAAIDSSHYAEVLLKKEKMNALFLMSYETGKEN